MNTSIRSTTRTVGVAVRAMVVLTLVLGVGYPAVITGVGQLTMPARANGSLTIDARGTVVGSSVLGQSFADAAGRPLARYLQPRPSAAGKGYDAMASGGSNAGPENPTLVAAIAARRAWVAAFNGVAAAAVPADAVTASGSGLDPDISPAYAQLQVARIAAARHVPEATVRDVVERHVRDRTLGYIGEPTVNVLEVNLALDSMEAAR